jgi:Ca-activated chloride channel family protein
MAAPRVVRPVLSLIALFGTQCGGEADRPALQVARDEQIAATPAVAPEPAAATPPPREEAKNPSAHGLRGAAHHKAALYALGSPAGAGASMPMPMPMPAPAPSVPASAEPAPPLLDPNARYATTYRPGGAALAAFDAALARGTVPVAYRDLVGDFGARYAPPLAAPAHGALAVSVATERAALPPSGGPLHLRVALRSAAATHLTRARLSVSLALDVSGSMAGGPIANARAAAAALVRRLEPSDYFSLVTFSEDAELVIPAGPIGPRRAEVLARIARIASEGGTNLGAGLDLAYAQARSPQAPADALRVVMLLSDGQANAGETDPQALAARSGRAFQDGVETSVFGLGDSFDAPLLSALADRGAGGYYYLADAKQIAPAFARELDARLVPAALAVELRVRLRPEVRPTKVYGSRQLDALEAAVVREQEVSADAQARRRDGIKRDRQSDAPGGMRFFMPSFARGDRYALLIRVELPAGVGDRPLGSVEIRYKDRLLGKNVTAEIPVRVRYARSDADSAATLDPTVLRTVQAFAAGDAILGAAGRIERGDRAGAASLLGERAALLARAASSLDEPRFADDGRRLARLASAVGRVEDPLALALLLRSSGSGYLQ